MLHLEVTCRGSVTQKLFTGAPVRHETRLTNHVTDRAASAATICGEIAAQAAIAADRPMDSRRVVAREERVWFAWFFLLKLNDTRQTQSLRLR
jgi:hypothetical protein